MAFLQTLQLPEGSLRRLMRMESIYILGLCAALYFLYHDVLAGMVSDWANDENNSHAFLIPFISGYLAWNKKEQLATAPLGVSNWGLGLILLGLFMLCLGHFSSELFSMRLSFIVVLSGLVLFFCGKAVFALLWAPLAYLLFMVPVPAIIMDTVAFPLKLFVTTTSVEILKALGVMVLREGNIMMFPNITLEVVNACSGLRSIVSLFAMGTAMALLFEPLLRNRIILVSLSLPISVLTNIVRVVATGLLSQYYGAAAAEGFFHEFAGFAVFGVALLLFFLAWRMLRSLSS